MGIISRERVFVSVAVVLFFAAFGTVIVLDNPHGYIGDDFREGDFIVSIEKNEGHIAIPELPTDLIIYGANQEASLDFTVVNNDEDNDIDTVYITIPGAEMINATTEWYDPLFPHEWSFESPSSGVAKVSAEDDLPGRVFGGSAMYDVAGNIDDALDYDSTLDISEGITITLEFTTPSSAGTKVGNNAIDLEVSDEQTEGNTDRFSMNPFPYPYLVIDTDYEFILYEVEGADIDIGIGGIMAFGTSSRASDFIGSQYGFKYKSNVGTTIAVLNAPTDDTIVNPVIIAEDDLGGQFTVSMTHYKTTTIDPTQPTSSWISIEASQDEYTGDLPTTAGGTVSLDIDGDGLFTDNDDDIDGDGINNNEDSDPFDAGIVNHHPTLTSVIPVETSIPKNKKLVIEASADDVDNDDLTYTWSVDPDTGWTATGSIVEIVLEEFEIGSYTFIVTVTDGNGGQTQDSTVVDVIKAEETKGLPLLPIIIFGIIFAVIAILTVFLILRGRKSRTTEETLEEIDNKSRETITDQSEHETYASQTSQEIESFEQAPLVQEPSSYESMSVQEDLAPIKEMDYPIDGSSTLQPIEEPKLDEADDLERLIQDIDDMEEIEGDVCPDCGSSLEPDDHECSNCGAQFKFALECPNCGNKTEGGQDICPHCGVKFIEEE